MSPTAGSPDDVRRAAPEDPRRDASDAPRRVVARAVEDLTARRLGRAFLPLGLLFAAGVVLWVTWGVGSLEGILLTLGAPASAGAMVLEGVRVVRETLDDEAGGGWIRLAPLAGLLPPAYGTYALVAVGLLPLTREAAGTAAIAGSVFVILVAGRYLWLLWRLSEVRTLARTMVLPAPEEEG